VLCDSSCVPLIGIIHYFLFIIKWGLRHKYLIIRLPDASKFIDTVPALAQQIPKIAITKTLLSVNRLQATP
jgi:hypothetical protein